MHSNTHPHPMVITSPLTFTIFQPRAAMVNHPGNQRLAVGDYTVQGCLTNILDLNEKNDFSNSEIIKAECVVVLASMILSEPSSCCCS